MHLTGILRNRFQSAMPKVSELLLTMRLCFDLLACVEGALTYTVFFELLLGACDDVHSSACGVKSEHRLALSLACLLAFRLLS